MSKSFKISSFFFFLTFFSCTHGMSKLFSFWKKEQKINKVAHVTKNNLLSEKQFAEFLKKNEGDKIGPKISFILNIVKKNPEGMRNLFKSIIPGLSVLDFSVDNRVTKFCFGKRKTVSGIMVDGMVDYKKLIIKVFQISNDEDPKKSKNDFDIVAWLHKKVQKNSDNHKLVEEVTKNCTGAVLNCVCNKKEKMSRNIFELFDVPEILINPVNFIEVALCSCENNSGTFMDHFSNMSKEVYLTDNQQVTS